MNRRGEQGAALVVVLMATALFAAMITSLTLATITDGAIAANYREAAETRYAAEAAVEFALQEIAPRPDWTDLISAPGASTFVDGAPAGERQVGAARIDLTEETIAMTAMATPPAGAEAGPCVLYAYGWLRNIAPPAAGGPQIYVAVWLADRSPRPRNPDEPPGTLTLVGAAFGWRGSRRVVEAMVERGVPPGVRVVAWRELP